MIILDTVEKIKEEGPKMVKVARKAITARDLMPDLAEKYGKRDEDKDKDKDKDKSKIPGRNVEDELKQLREKKKREDEQLKKYQEAEEEKERQRQAEYEMMMEQENAVSTNPAKQKKSRGSAFAHNKKSAPDKADMSATAEFQKKVN